MKLEIGNTRKTEKSQITWRLNKMLLNHHFVKKELKTVIKKYLETEME